MTSATYSKSSFKQGLAVFWWSVRSNLPIIIIYLSLLAFTSMLNIVGTMGVSTMLGGVMDEEVSIIKNLPISSEISNAALFGILFSIIASIRCFGYLHGKREIDMFGSLPVSRRTLFFSRLAAAAAIGAAPMLVVLLALNIFAPHTGDNSLLNTLNAFLGITANVTFIGLLSVCCGKTSDKIISYLMINFAFPVAIIMIQVMPASFLSGYDLQFHKLFILALTPLAAHFSNMPIYWTVFSAACIALCFLLLKRRKSESAQSHFAFKLPHVLIKLLASFATGVVAAYIFLLIGVDYKYKPDLGTEYLKFWLGMIIGSFLVYLCVQIILAHGFKGFGKSLITYGAMIVCFGVYFTVLATGALGYSSYVPSADSVKSVSFTDDFNQGLLVRRSVDDRKVIEGAVDAHKQIIETTEKEKSMIVLSGKTISKKIDNLSRYMYIDYDDVNNFTVTYYLKNGMKIRRSYIIDKPRKIRFLYTKEYQENYYPLFTFDEKYLREAWTDSCYGDDYADFNRKESLELVKAIREDYRKYGPVKNDDYDYYSAQFTFYENDNKFENDLVFYQYVDVPAEYKATRKLIKAAN